jgi:hypothetical protein
VQSGAPLASFFIRPLYWCVPPLDLIDSISLHSTPLQHTSKSTLHALAVNFFFQREKLAALHMRIQWRNSKKKN